MTLNAQTSEPAGAGTINLGPDSVLPRPASWRARRDRAASAGRPAIREAHDVHPEVRCRDRRYRRSLIVADAVAALLALLLCTLVVDTGAIHATLLVGLPVVILASKLSGLYDRDELLIRKTT